MSQNAGDFTRFPTFPRFPRFQDIRAGMSGANDHPHRLWWRPSRLHAWRPVGPPGSYKECVWRIGEGDRPNGFWWIRPAGLVPDGKVIEDDGVEDLTTTQ